MVKVADRITNLRPPPRHCGQDKRQFYRSRTWLILERLGGLPAFGREFQQRISAGGFCRQFLQEIVDIFSHILYCCASEKVDHPKSDAAEKLPQRRSLSAVFFRSFDVPHTIGHPTHDPSFPRAPRTTQIQLEIARKAAILVQTNHLARKYP